MVWEKFFRQPSDLNVVSPQAGKVFDKDGGGFSLFQLADHFHEAGAIHRHAGNTVIQEMNQICVALFLCDFGKQFLLRRDLSRYVFAKECAIRIDKQQKECYNNAVINNGIII